jgi:amino acid transporter
VSPTSLRRELRFWEAIALSIGIMAPTAAMALNGVAVSQHIGRAVPLAFLIATVAIALIAYSFVRLTSYVQHAGSTYALAGLTLGPRAGFFAGWALLFTYSCFIAANIAEIGLFGVAFLNGAGIWHGSEWIVISLVAAALVWFLAYGDVKVATRALLSFEGLSVGLIVVITVVIYAKVLGHSAPGGQTFSLKAFAPTHGTYGAIGVATVFGLLSFGGFEGAAALGEETANPRRNIPLAIAVAVAFAGLFYTIVMFAQSLGFGLGPAGVKAFSNASSPLGDLSRSYLGSWMEDLINLGALISAFASCIGSAAGASRILFALGRDGFVTTRLGESSRRTGAPVNALAVVMTIGIAAVVALRLNHTDVVSGFFYPGTLGVLSMLVAYFVVQLGAFRFLHVGRREPPWRAVIVVLAGAAIVYTFYKQVWPKQPYPYDVFPLVLAGWCVAGIAVTLAFPALARRIGANLRRAELDGRVH